MKKLSEMSYNELYDIVVKKGGVKFRSKPRRIDLEGVLDEIDPTLIKNIDQDEFVVPK